MLTWKELSLQNIKLTIFSLLKILNDAEIIPHLVEIDFIEDICQRIMVTLIKLNFLYINL